MGIFDIFKTGASKNKMRVGSDDNFDSIIGKYYRIEDLTMIGYTPSKRMILFPFDGRFYDTEERLRMFHKAVNIEGVKKYFPLWDVSTVEQMKNSFVSDLLFMQDGYKLTYLILVDNYPVGFIFCETPDYNQKTINYNYWTINYMIFNQFAHRGLMSKALIQMLAFLKLKLKVPEVRFLVESDNIKSIGLLKKINCRKIEDDGFGNVLGGKPPVVYSYDLEHTYFQGIE